MPRVQTGIPVLDAVLDARARTPTLTPTPTPTLTPILTLSLPLTQALDALHECASTSSPVALVLTLTLIR